MEKIKKRTAFFVFAVIFFVGRFGALRAEEGMWLFTDPPLAAIEKAYGFRPDADFLNHLQKSSLRFSNGGSASFVSSNGLVMTNHHVAFSFLSKLRTDENRCVEDGFYAAELSDELKCADLEVVMLESVEDVTEQVRAAGEGLSEDEARTRRREVIHAIENRSRLDTGLYSEVMSFYSGGLYHLYRYKKFTDVRLVFAPEENVGYFGGVTDNFEYPRYCLDVAFFRIYENDRPYRPEHFLQWSSAGAAENDLVFVTGHPGRTDRLNTVSHLKFLRDVYYPYFLNNARRREVSLTLFSERGVDFARRSSSNLFRLRNTRKNRSGILLGLQTPALFETKRSQENALRKAAEAKNAFADGPNPWSQIDEALAVWREQMIEYDLLEGAGAFDSQLFRLAREIVRFAAESAKPDADRLEDYRETALPTVRTNILSPTPIDTQLDEITLGDSLGMYLEYFGDRERGTADESGFGFLAGRAPNDRAAELVGGSVLTDLAEREKLLDGGLDAVNASDDPMIRLALAVEPSARSLADRQRRLVTEPMKDAYARLARLRFELVSEGLYPDATFSLRLSYGSVLGYTASDGTAVPPQTTFDGAFRRAKEHDWSGPFSLSEKWNAHRGQINLTTPLNLVSTNDIIGGNSGSPLVNTHGEVVGLIFDGNVESLPLNFIFTQERARAVSVHSSAIVEALRKIYRADRIADELGK